MEVGLEVGNVDLVKYRRLFKVWAAILPQFSASFAPAMTYSQQRLLSQLATSPNELASGLGQCLEALRLISVLPRASPVFVRYASAASPTIKAFGRDHLSRVPLRVCRSPFFFFLSRYRGSPINDLPAHRP